MDELDPSQRSMCLIQTALTDQSWSGVVNAVAPEPVSMAVFSKQLGRSLNRPSLLPVPGPVLQLLLGDGAKVVLEGQQVASERLDSLGFSFRYPTLGFSPRRCHQLRIPLKTAAMINRLIAGVNKGCHSC